MMIFTLKKRRADARRFFLAHIILVVSNQPNLDHGY